MKIIRHHKGFVKTAGDSGAVMHCEDEKGVDWYAIADNTPADEKAVHIMVRDGVVVSVSDDICRLWPAGCDVISVKAPASIKMDDLAEVKGDQLIISENVDLTFKANLLAAVNNTEKRITILERAQRLGMTTPDEVSELEQLERYSVYLMRAKGPDLLALSDM